MEPSSEDIDILEEEFFNIKSEEDEDTDEEEDEEDYEVEEVRDDDNAAKDEETSPQASDELEKNKRSESLNLNNEVVKLRKEVKRVRTLIIRKLTRQIGGLKKKKGKEMEIERNQRRAARLLEEIHAMKTLSPDVVTKTALRKNLNFELVCKNPKSTISDRAVARIATHPQFNKKIEAIKFAVKAFKDERSKGGKQMEEKREKVQNKVKKVTPQLPDKEEEKQVEVTAEPQKSKKEEKEDVFKDPVSSTFIESEKQTVEERIPKNLKTATVKSVKDVKMKNKPESKDKEKKPAPEPLLQSDSDVGESELESSDEEDTQYFDDSTEERFHNKSSQSEESDSDDDFFIGKVSKFKKKKLQDKTEGGTERQNGPETKGDSNKEVKGKPDRKLKAPPLHSIFCSSLAKHAAKSAERGAGRGAGRGEGRGAGRGAGRGEGRGAGRGAGRGGNAFRGNSKGSRGMQRDFGKTSRFHNQEQDTERHSFTSKTDSSKKGFGSESRGKGRGAGEAMRGKGHRGAGGFTHQRPQQALHPSWEASKKRKEQQGQIMAFQGKKIKFDDDD